MRCLMQQNKNYPNSVIQQPEWFVLEEFQQNEKSSDKLQVV